MSVPHLTVVAVLSSPVLCYSLLMLLSAMPSMQHMGKPRTSQQQPEGEWCLLAELGQECIMQGTRRGTQECIMQGTYRIGGDTLTASTPEL